MSYNSKDARDPYVGKAWHQEGMVLELDNYDYWPSGEDPEFSPPVAALELGLRWLHDRAEDDRSIARARWAMSVLEVELADILCDESFHAP